MTKRLLLICLACAAVMSAGCLHWKKNAKPEETTTSEVEGPFRQRWIDRRAAELVAQGQTPEAARAQANGEFKAQFGAIGGTPK